MISKNNIVFIGIFAVALLSLIIAYNGGKTAIAQAAEANNGEFAGGSGVEEDPFLIQTADHLNNVRNHLNAHYKLIADIDLTDYSEGEGWQPIKAENLIHRFEGVLDGNGFVISNLNINQPDSIMRGLFFAVGNEGIIKNLGLENVKIVGSDRIGAIAGSLTGTIENCYVKGYSAQSTEERRGTIGGIAASSSGVIRNCYVEGSIKGDFLGGGIAGHNTGKIINCYSVVEVNMNRHGGGITGGYHRGEVINSYYDRTRSGMSDTGKGVPKSIRELSRRATFEGWDFENIWGINEGEGYPYLQWEKERQ